MLIANNTIDINSDKRPITIEPTAIRVEGMEKYRVSLKIVITIIEYTIPIVIRIKPGLCSLYVAGYAVVYVAGYGIPPAS